MAKSDYNTNDPRYLAEELLDKFEALHKETGKQATVLCLKEMMKEATPERRLEYDMARIHIKNMDK